MKALKIIIPDDQLTAVLKFVSPLAVFIDVTDGSYSAQTPVLAPQPDVMVDAAAELEDGVTRTPTEAKGPMDPKTRGALGGRKRWEKIPHDQRVAHGRAAAEKRWAAKSPTATPTPRPQGAASVISVADTILRDFMIGDEPVRLGPVREHLLSLGFNRNSASSAFDTLIKRGDVRRVGEALYQRVDKSKAQA